jgi:hypothetical protein
MIDQRHDPDVQATKESYFTIFGPANGLELRSRDLILPGAYGNVPDLHTANDRRQRTRD